MVADASLLLKLDARVKILFTLAFLLALNLLPHGAWTAYTLFGVLLFSLAAAGQVRLSVLLRRSLVSFVFILSALPLVFTGPEPHQVLPVLGWEWQISLPGMLRVGSISVRAWLSVMAAVLLSGSTPMPKLLLGLQRLRVPVVFIAIVNLMWRYLTVIRHEALSLMHARSSRSASLGGTASRAGGSVIWRAQVTGGMAGNLFLRSLERADRVYAAMLARGYNGQMMDADLQPIPRNERGGMIAAILLLLVLFLIGILTGAAY